MFSSGGAAATYVTWKGSEPDKTATAWLITRFVDPDAKFEMSSQGSELNSGVPFDVPGAKWRRTSQHTAFEAVLVEHNLGADTPLGQIGHAIHVLEFSRWARPSGQLAAKIESDLAQIRSEYGTEIPPLNRFFTYFDELYASLSTGSGVTKND